MQHLPLFLFLYSNMSKVKFKKEERLCTKIAIDKLFKSGESFVVYPYKVIYKKTEKKVPTDELVKILITIPKRNFKKAAHRNQLKRRTKEAYRLNKAHFYSALNKKTYSLDLGLIYIGSKELKYEELSSKIILILNRLITINE